MQDFTDGERRQVLGEALMDEFKVIREYLEDLPDMKKRIVRVEEKVDKLSDNMNVVKSVIKTPSDQLEGNEQRLTVLEQTA